ncbi:hypothetical protein [Paenibacillus sp. IHBB 10380]|nr:hypothetical protein [Paenibacillus sp. IHBB 10380]
MTSIEYVIYMAKAFQESGILLALNGNSLDDERSQVIGRLERGKTMLL